MKKKTHKFEWHGFGTLILPPCITYMFAAQPRSDILMEKTPELTSNEAYIFDNYMEEGKGSLVMSFTCIHWCMKANYRS